MKIIRTHDRHGNICHAALQSDGTALKLAGDLFASPRLTDEAVSPDQLLAPLEPEVIYCIGLNYRRHAEEGNAPIPEWPVVFMKSKASVQHPGGPIELPRHLRSDEVDYECELAVVIGRRCKNVSKQNARRPQDATRNVDQPVGAGVEL